MVFFESPQRIVQTISDLADALGGDRPAAVCRELTKVHEEVIRGSLRDVAEQIGELRGEITLVVGGAPDSAPAEVSDADLVDRVRQRIREGEAHSAAVAAVAREAGRPRREVYDLMVAAKDRGTSA